MGRDLERYTCGLAGFFVNQSTHNFPVVVKSRPAVLAVLDTEQQLPLFHPSLEVTGAAASG